MLFGFKKHLVQKQIIELVKPYWKKPILIITKTRVFMKLCFQLTRLTTQKISRRDNAVVTYLKAQT